MLSVSSPLGGLKGKFITLYGVNNIGKSTHAHKLVDRLKREGYDAVYLKYPIYDLEPTGPTLNAILRGLDGQGRLSREKMENGKIVADYISEEVLQSIFTQNRQDFEPQLRKMLDEGKIVIAEDYTGTGIAWGTAKGLALEKVEAFNAHLLKEDLSLLLVGTRSLQAREEHHLHEQNDDLIAKVTQILNQLGQKYDWYTIQLQERIEDSAEMIWQEVKKFLDSSQN